MEKFKFLNEHVRILNGEKPIDMNDRKNEYYAIQYDLPDNFSEKAKRHFYDYYDGTALIFEYKGKLVVTDESLWLTEYGDGSADAPYGCPRWICDSWEQLEKELENNCDELSEWKDF